MKKLSLSSETACRIAVVGLGCYYPGAKSPLQLWENILARRQQFRKMPDVRLPNAEYFDSDPLVPNKTYQNKAALIDGYEFDWMGKRIPKQTYESTDIVHWLALDTALQAIADANLNKDNISKEKTGVILGNTLTGEFTRSNQMLLRWPYVRKALRASAKEKGLMHVVDEIEETLEKYYKSVFAPVTEDTLAGGLANTVAGRICNYLDLHGGGYIVDGACSSSMLAIVTAANYLELGQMDMVIAGGVDISLDTFELVGFAKTSALTPDEMRVYDKSGKGFIPGEGCGMVVLKRYFDAVRDNDQIYAVINGWGISSDGKGGITAPSAAGQSRALIRAYTKAGFDPQHLDFIEGHGTGTTVGDKVELEGISIALSTSKEIEPRSCGVTSFKSIVGHTKAAAGIGAFIKTVLAVNQRIVPPTAGLYEKNDIFDDKAKAVYPVIYGQVRDPRSILYAGVSAMGFGGINSHVTLQSGNPASPKFKASLDARKLMASNQTHELFLFSGASREELEADVLHVLGEADGISYAELADLACSHNSKTDFDKTLRAAVVASTPFDLERKLRTLLGQLKQWDGVKNISSENATIVAGKRLEKPKVGALFPGQGSQKVNMAFKIIERHDWLRETVEHSESQFLSSGSGQVVGSIYRPVERVIDKAEADQWNKELKQTNIAQPAITLTSLLWFKYLTRLGIDISCATGHSLGELMAFYASGLLSEDTLLAFAAFRGKSMAEHGSGTMASLLCPKAKAEEYIGKCEGYATVANINAPEQTVISGEVETIRNIVKLAQADQVGAVELPVSAAFHSKLIEEVSMAIEGFDALKNKGTKNEAMKLISSTNGKEVDSQVDLNTYFAKQAVSQVDFISAANAMKDHCDLLVEVGPGKVLSGLVSGITADIKAFPVEIKPGDDLSLNILLANAFTLGCRIQIDELYSNRLIRDFIPARERSFLVNPLERPFAPENIAVSGEQHTGIDSWLGMSSYAAGFDTYLKERSSFIRDIIETDFRYYSKNTGASGVATAATRSQIASQNSVQPAVATAESQSNDVRTVLFKKIESMTGFSADGFKDHMKLLDDFNLDSIKSGALLGHLTKTLNLTGKLNIAQLSNATLGDIINKVSALAGTPTQVAPAVENSQAATLSLKETVFAMLSERTGFPADSLKSDFRLLDDLNLDSLKAGAFIAELRKKFNIQGKIDTSKWSNGRIGDIIDTISGMLGSAEKPSAAASEQPAKVDHWVNAYTVKLETVPMEISDENISGFWNNKSLVLIGSGSDKEAGTRLSGSFRKYTNNIIVVDETELPFLQSLEHSCMLVMMPESSIDVGSVAKTVELLSAVARKIQDVSMLGFLQYGDGKFSRNAIQEKTPAHYSAVSFAASLHHERPDMKIRVMEAEKQIPENRLAELVLSEFISDQGFMAAGYDAQQLRSQMVYQVAAPTSVEDNAILYGENEVLVATGGAKGITAECVLAFASKHKCRTALIGSSPAHDEVKETLARYAKNDLLVQYYSCDVANEAMVRETMEKIRKDLGDISILIHGAGKNVPRRAEQVSASDALDEISPKLMGIINLCNALEGSPLKSVIAFTSIIGVTGMPGNSWYAFANETADRLLRELGRRRNITTRTIAYSVWDEVGMGARMGSTKVLAGMGIGAIAPALGVEQFVRWTDYKTLDQQVVVSSAMGDLDTWYLMKPELPGASRYIGDIIHFEPGRELITRVKLNRTTDLYVDDHNYEGSLLFPTVFGIEAMAEAAQMLSGIKDVKSLIFENISLQRPIIVPESGETEIEIKAVAIDNSLDHSGNLRIRVGISTENTGFESFHFSSEIVFNPANEKVARKMGKTSEALKINPKSDLYSWLLFQGKKFQHIRKLFSLKQDEVIFDAGAIVNDPAEECFSSEVRKPLLLGSPLFRDILLQSVQLFLTRKKYLPVNIARWEILDVEKQARGGVITSRLRNIDDEKATCDVEFVTEGQLIEKIDGYVVKALDETASYPLPEELADLQQLYSTAVGHEFAQYRSMLKSDIHYRIFKHDEEFNTLNRNIRHSLEKEFFSKAYRDLHGSSDQEPGLTWADNGKPVLENSTLKLSLSHSRSVLLLTMGEQDQGCDIEFIENRSVDDWKDLLDNKFSRVIDQVVLVDKDYNISATRIWCVREAMIKSTGSIPMDIAIEKKTGKGIAFRVKTSGQKDATVLTFPVNILPNTSVVISMIAELTADESPEGIQSGRKADGYTLFNSQEGCFTHQFLTTFKDCKGFFGKTHFTNFPSWMGSLRELVLAPIGNELLKDLGSGEYGMVTNASDIKILNEADTLNNIKANLWITDKSDLPNSFIDLGFEFSRNNPETGEAIRLAQCNLSTTWVRIEGRGIVKQSPIPEYFMDFLSRYIRAYDHSRGRKNGSPYPGMKDIGRILYEDSSAIRPKHVILEKTFQTGISNGNAVGNLYYSNYYDWQSKLIEQYIYDLAPDTILRNGKEGEFLTVECQVNHLQEAMPFEDISTCMFLQKIFENGLKFYFEYYSVHGSERRKLAYGSNTLIWSKRLNDRSLPAVTGLPAEIMGVVNSLVLV